MVMISGKVVTPVPILGVLILGIDKEKILAIAQKYILKGQSQKAVKELQKLVESTPRDSRLRIKLADLYLRNGDNENAFQEYLKLAELYEEEDLNARAISIYRKILSINPDYVEALHKTAKLYIKEGLGGSAKNCYQTVLKIRPDDPEALSALEEIDRKQLSRETSGASLSDDLSFLKKRPSSESRIVSNDRITPQQGMVSEQRMGGMRGMGETRPDVSLPGSGDSALPSNGIEKAPGDDKDHQDAEMHYHLGIAYREMELFDYAITEFEMASESSFMHFDCCIMLGTCYMERGDYDKSIEYLKKAAGIRGLSDERLARLNFNLGLAYEASGMIREALDTFRQALSLDRSLSEAQEKIEKLQTPPE
jgi:tetratricopeptide (TPR) repeat protein